MIQAGYGNLFDLYNLIFYFLGVAAWFERLNVKNWVTFAFLDVGCATLDTLTSNIAESANNWYGLTLRCSDPVSALFTYLLQLNAVFNKRAKEHEVYLSTFSKKAQTKLHHLEREARQCTVPILRYFRIKLIRIFNELLGYRSSFGSPVPRTPLQALAP